jgi:hypothetical protein
MAKDSRLRIIVLGWLVRGPLGGSAWVRLNYLLGLIRLGHDVYYIEDSDDYPGCYDPLLGDMTVDPSYGLRFASDAFARVGLEDRWSYFDAHTNQWRGPRASDACELCQTSDLVLNISGVNPIRDWLARVPHRVFIDQDPGFTQIRNLTDPEFRRRSEEHTAFFSIGENIGKPCSSIPPDGFPWHPTRQPVPLDVWPYTRGVRKGRYTTIMRWESYPVQQYRGLRLGMKSDAFRQFADLPRRLGGIFELAIDGHTAPLAAIRAAGWRIADSNAVSRDPWTYQSFIRASKGEFGIAKEGYVTTHCGWFADRSAAYLACGRPVLAQDTGFSEWLPCGRGVIAFRSPDEVVSAVSEVEGDYDMHCRTARELAEEYFSARHVLPSLIDAAMTSSAEDR